MVASLHIRGLCSDGIQLSLADKSISIALRMSLQLQEVYNFANNGILYDFIILANLSRDKIMVIPRNANGNVNANHI